MEEKKPDIIVWNKEDGYHAKFSKYPTNLGSAIFEIPNVPMFKENSSRKMMSVFEQEKQELIDKVKKLYDEYNDSIMVWESKFSFEPIVGKKYFLYLCNDEYLLSLISPEEWNKEVDFVGEFLLNSDNKWIKIR
jgi:hypothetical protein